MKCIYNETGACTNTLCPACLTLCPVPDTEGICQYEVREEDDNEYYTLTPKGCLLLAFMHNNIIVDEHTFDNIWNEFAETMEALGYIEEG